MSLQLRNCEFLVGRSVIQNYVPEICEWVTTSGDLSLISAESGPELLPEILVGWLAQAYESFAVIHCHQVIGFGALSSEQAPVPSGGIEAVHTIVHPSFRRQGIGTQLTNVRVLYAKNTGFTRVFFRVIPTNWPRIRLLNKLGIALAAVPLIDGFTWYEHPVSSDLRGNTPQLA